MGGVSRINNEHALHSQNKLLQLTKKWSCSSPTVVGDCKVLLHKLIQDVYNKDEELGDENRKHNSSASAARALSAVLFLDLI